MNLSPFNGRLMVDVQKERPLPQSLICVLVAQSEVLAAAQVRLTSGLAVPRQPDLFVV